MSLRFHHGQYLLQANARHVAVANVVDVWGIELDCAPYCVQQFAILLDTDERARAERFRTETLRRRFVVAHGALRSILARYQQRGAADLRYVIGPFGKPALLDEPTLHFNLSHAESRALLAVTRDHAVGADIEKVRQDIDALAIAGRYFFGNEYQDIALAAPEQTVPRFFAHWVAKEAVLKGEGVGIGYALDRFGMQFDAARTQATITTCADDAPRSDWCVRMLPVDPNWYAAVAACGTDWDVRAECE